MCSSILALYHGAFPRPQFSHMDTEIPTDWGPAGQGPCAKRVAPNETCRTTAHANTTPIIANARIAGDNFGLKTFLLLPLVWRLLIVDIKFTIPLATRAAYHLTRRDQSKKITAGPEGRRRRTATVETAFLIAVYFGCGVTSFCVGMGIWLSSS
jgi:hypothetical protein